MKKQTLLVLTTLTVLGLLVAGVTPVAASVEQVKSEDYIPSIEFTGLIESIDGDQVIVDGQVVTVDIAMIEALGLEIGNMVEVEATLNESGALIADYVELEDSLSSGDDDMYDDSDDDHADDHDDDDDADDDDGDDDEDDGDDDDMDDDDTSVTDTSGNDTNGGSTVVDPGV